MTLRVRSVAVIGLSEEVRLVVGRGLQRAITKQMRAVVNAVAM